MRTLRNIVLGVGGAAGLAMLFAIGAAAQQPATAPAPTPAEVVPGAPTIDQSLEMRSASAPRISPDGRWVAYEITRTNWDANAFERELWLADTNSGQRMRLTSGKGSSFGAQWSPDGKWIAFLSDRPAALTGAKEGKTQIWLIAAAGGEARELTKVETGVAQFEWAPNGKTIAFTSSDPETKARKDRTEKYGEIQVISGDYSMAHIWLLDVPVADTDAAHPPDPKRLTEGSTFTVGGFSWAPDSSRIAFSAQRDPDLGSADTADIYVVTVADKSVKKIVETSGPDSDPVWSPDGKWIAFDSRPEGQADIYAVGVAGGPPRPMTNDSSEDVVPSWSRDGQWIYFASNRSGSWQVWKVPFGGGPKVQVTRQGGFAAFESSDRQWVYYALSRSQPGLYRVPLDGGREEPVLDRLKPGYWGYWALGRGGIYFLDAPQATAVPSLYFYGFAGGDVLRLAAIDRNIPLGDSGMALSPDGRSLLYTQVDQSGSDVMLADFGPR